MDPRPVVLADGVAWFPGDPIYVTERHSDFGGRDRPPGEDWHVVDYGIVPAERGMSLRMSRGFILMEGPQRDSFPAESVFSMAATAAAVAAMLNREDLVRSCYAAVT